MDHSRKKIHQSILRSPYCTIDPGCSSWRNFHTGLMGAHNREVVERSTETKTVSRTGTSTDCNRERERKNCWTRRRKDIGWSHTVHHTTGRKSCPLDRTGFRLCRHTSDSNRSLCRNRWDRTERKRRTKLQRRHKSPRCKKGPDNMSCWRMIDLHPRSLLMTPYKFGYHSTSRTSVLHLNNRKATGSHH